MLCLGEWMAYPHLSPLGEGQMGLDEGWIGRPQSRMKGSDAVIIKIRKKKMLTDSR